MSPHQALLKVKKNFRHFTWCIKGEISPSLHSLPENISLFALDEYILRQLAEESNGEKNGEKVMPACYLRTSPSKRAQYIRSGLEFVIGISDTKKNALTVFEKIRQYFAKRLHVDSNHTKLFLSHLERPIPFIGYEFFKHGRNRSYVNSHTERHPDHRPSAEKISLRIPARKIKEFARLKGYGRMEQNVITHRRNIIHKPEREILGIYNSELKSFTEYYRLAENLHHLGKLYYLAEGSFIKTIACKRKSTCAKTARSMRAHMQGALALVEKSPKSMNEIYPFIKLSNYLKETRQHLQR